MTWEGEEDDRPQKPFDLRRGERPEPGIGENQSSSVFPPFFVEQERASSVWRAFALLGMFYLIHSHRQIHISIGRLRFDFAWRLWEHFAPDHFPNLKPIPMDVWMLHIVEIFDSINFYTFFHFFKWGDFFKQTWISKSTPVVLFFFFPTVCGYDYKGWLLPEKKKKKDFIGLQIC